MKIIEFRPMLDIFVKILSCARVPSFTKLFLIEKKMFLEEITQNLKIFFEKNMKNLRSIETISKIPLILCKRAAHFLNIVIGSLINLKVYDS